MLDPSAFAPASFRHCLHIIKLCVSDVSNHWRSITPPSLCLMACVASWAVTPSLPICQEFASTGQSPPTYLYVRSSATFLIPSCSCISFTQLHLLLLLKRGLTCPPSQCLPTFLPLLPPSLPSLRTPRSFPIYLSPASLTSSPLPPSPFFFLLSMPESSLPCHLPTGLHIPYHAALLPFHETGVGDSAPVGTKAMFDNVCKRSTCSCRRRQWLAT